jgi:predicted TIM-barrel fold metal-dependent hydrolase
MKAKLEDLVLVSVDDHVIEPPTMYDQHLTKAQKAFAPTFHTDSEGKDYWLYDGHRVANLGLNAVVGRPKTEYGFEPLSLSHLRKGCYDPAARVDDMNANGVLASLPFPTIVGFDGSLFHRFRDKGQALVLLRAYNDWHIDEWCGSHPGRFIPNALLPYWDMDATVAEVNRVAKKGCHSVSMMDNPANRGLPSIHNAYWAPFWKVCAENRVVISMHHGTGNAAQHPSQESPIDAWMTCMAMSISLALADYLHLDALRTYPDLKLSLVESGTGWIPYVLRRADFIQQQHSQWTNATFGGRTASEMFHDHFLCTFVHDDGGFEMIDEIGARTMCYEQDYPHSDTQWPYGPEALMRFLPKLTDEQVELVTHRNTMREYSFDPFTTLGGRQNCTVSALRAKAQHVDTQERSMPGHDPTERSGSHDRVTSADVLKLFANNHPRIVMENIQKQGAAAR